MNLKTEQRRRFIINFLYFLLIFALVVVFARIGLPVLAPFVIAFVVALILGPLVKIISKKLPIKKGVVAAVIVVLFYSVVGTVIVIGGIELSKSLVKLIIRIPELYTQYIESFLWDTVARIEEMFSRLPEDTVAEFTEYVKSFISDIGTTITEICLKLVTNLGDTATSVPGLFFDVVITIVSTVFFTMDGGVIKSFILNQFTEEKAGLIIKMIGSTKKIIKQYIFSYAIIMLVTFAEIFIGLSILKIENAALIAALIALVDLMPIVGSGVIIWPWAIISLVKGDVAIGIGLIVLWGIICTIRYIIEPKIVGDRVGLHPLVTLVSMVVGTYLFGGIGILLLPLIVAVVQNLNATGVIHLYNNPQKENEDDKKSHLVDKVLYGVKNIRKTTKK